MNTGNLNVLANLTASILDKLQDNIMINAFRIAINGSLTQFNMIDGIVDEYEDESGIDNPNSINESYNSTDDYYSPTADTLDTSPFSHMKMEDNTDEGTGANAVSNIGTPTYTSGHLNNALTLDGSTDALNINALEADIRSDTVGSISVWFNTDVLDSTDAIWAFNGATGTRLRLQVQSDDKLMLRFTNSAGSALITQNFGTISISTWYHVVIVQDGISLKAYLDGSDATNLTVTTDVTTWLATNTTSVGRIGCENFSGGDLNFFNGQIDDFRYYQNYALSSDEVVLLYNSGTGTEADQPGGDTDNMTLISDTFTAEAEPDIARIVILEEDIDSITLNTDLKVYASRDSGSSWVQGTLADEGDFDTSKRILVANFDLTQSGIGSGTSMEYKYETLNNKDLKIHASSLNWD